MFPPKVGDYSMAEDVKDNEIKKKKNGARLWWSLAGKCISLDGIPTREAYGITRMSSFLLLLAEFGKSTARSLSDSAQGCTNKN